MNRLVKNRLAIAIAVAVLLVAGGISLAVSLQGGGSNSGALKPTPPPAPPLSGAAKAAPGAVAAGRAVTGQWTAHPSHLSAAAITQLQHRVDDNERVRENLPVHHISSTSVQGLTAPLVRKHVVGAAADIAVADDSIVADGTSNLSTSTKEPSVAVDGNTIFETGNWFAVRSLDGGRTWQDFDPYTAFGNQFCCDQVVIYDPLHQEFFWLLQLEDSNNRGYLKLAASSASDAFSNYCTYTLTAKSFGLPATGDVDYNDLALTSHYLFVNSNIYPTDKSPGQAGVIRIPLDQFSSCGHISYTNFTDSTVMNLKPVQGAADVMFMGTNYIRNAPWGSSYRIYRWDDSSTNYSWYTKSIAPFNYETPHIGSTGDGNCASANGAVTNWCERTQGQTDGAVLAGSRLIFAFNASRVGSKRPFPYTRLLTFDAGDLSYQGSRDLFSTHVAILYSALAVNARGDVGGVFAWGGGVGSERFYPGIGAFIFSPAHPTWNVDFYLYGNGNACIYQKDQLYRWGDYLTVRPDYPYTNLWRGTGYDFAGNCGNGGSSVDHTFVFGRKQDMG